MTSIIVSTIILLFLVGINYGVMKLAEKDPGIISGFKMSEDPQQRERDRIWLDRLFSYMRRANIATLIGGAIGIVSGSHIIYIFALILPISIAVMLAYARRDTGSQKKGGNTVMVITILVVILIVSIPILYLSRSNLEVSFSDDMMEISGLYGREIPLSDINEVTLCNSLPEISLRTNGFSLGDTCLGHFRTTEGKNIILFTHSDKYFVRITQNDGTTLYLSYRDKDTTEQLLKRIQEKLPQP